MMKELKELTWKYAAVVLTNSRCFLSRLIRQVLPTRICWRVTASVPTWTQGFLPVWNDANTQQDNGKPPLYKILSSMWYQILAYIHARLFCLWNFMKIHSDGVLFSCTVRVREKKCRINNFDDDFMRVAISYWFFLRYYPLVFPCGLSQFIQRPSYSLSI